ncbi:hypothetical protein ACER0C_003601 [Sarotherodon galilaeus]
MNVTSDPHVASAIREYFDSGHTYEVILDMLKTNHEISISLRTLKTHLKEAGLYRRGNYSPLPEVRRAILNELRGPGQLFGYRTMWQVLKQKHKLHVKRSVVMVLLRQLNPQGIVSRTRRRFTRRTYHSMGPNYIWHVSVLICINTTVSCINGCPERIRADRGTENGCVEQMQMFLRRNHTDSFAGEKSFLYRRSMANQRIEGWWATLRKQSAQFWMNLFQTIQDDGHFTGDVLDKSLIQFCFLNLIQVKAFVNTCNSHKIRPSGSAASSRPVVMYSFPELHSTEDRLKPISMEETTVCMEECSPKCQHPCDETVFELCCLLMVENEWDVSGDPLGAADLYIKLREEVLQSI